MGPTVGRGASMTVTGAACALPTVACNELTEKQRRSRAAPAARAHPPFSPGRWHVDRGRSPFRLDHERVLTIDAQRHVERSEAQDAILRLVFGVAVVA